MENTAIDQMVAHLKANPPIDPQRGYRHGIADMFQREQNDYQAALLQSYGWV